MTGFLSSLLKKARVWMALTGRGWSTDSCKTKRPGNGADLTLEMAASGSRAIKVVVSETMVYAYWNTYALRQTDFAGIFTGVLE